MRSKLQHPVIQWICLLVSLQVLVTGASAVRITWKNPHIPEEFWFSEEYIEPPRVEGQPPDSELPDDFFKPRGNTPEVEELLRYVLANTDGPPEIVEVTEQTLSDELKLLQELETKSDEKLSVEDQLWGKFRQGSDGLPESDSEEKTLADEWKALEELGRKLNIKQLEEDSAPDDDYEEDPVVYPDFNLLKEDKNEDQSEETSNETFIQPQGERDDIFIDIIGAIPDENFMEPQDEKDVVFPKTRESLEEASDERSIERHNEGHVVFPETRESLEETSDERSIERLNGRDVIFPETRESLEGTSDERSIERHGGADVVFLGTRESLEDDLMPQATNNQYEANYDDDDDDDNDRSGSRFSGGLRFPDFMRPRGRQGEANRGAGADYMSSDGESMPFNGGQFNLPQSDRGPMRYPMPESIPSYGDLDKGLSGSKFASGDDTVDEQVEVLDEAPYSPKFKEIGVNNDPYKLDTDVSNKDKETICATQTMTQYFAAKFGSFGALLIILMLLYMCAISCFVHYQWFISIHNPGDKELL